MYRLYAHPFSSYCWKVLIALDERGVAFDYRMLDEKHPENFAELMRLWPLGKFPVLVGDDGRPVVESSIIIETVDAGPAASGARLIPADPDRAIDVRFMDRVFDNHVMTPMQAIVNQHIHYPGNTDAARIADAKAALETIYDWLEARLCPDGWACGDTFTMADCAAAPALFYSDWVHEIGEARPTLRGYRARLLARDSVRKAVDAARPYRQYFPPGAPDRD